MDKIHTVTAKFQVASIDGNTIKFNTQYDDTIPEDQRFQKATPWGSIEMQIDNPRALELFEVGKNYYATFTKAE